MSQVTGAAARPAPAPIYAQAQWWQGLVLTSVLAAVSLFFAQSSWARQSGLSALTIAILLGIVVGNTVFPRIASSTASGVDFAKNKLLRAGIILFGFHITFQQIGQVGWQGVALAALIVGLTFTLAVQIGTRVFKLDSQTAMLIGAGSAICGAAAVMATEPVLRSQSHKVSVAVATVVVFGTAAMFLYPLLYTWLDLSEQAYGIFVGSTIHEVAQVVAAGGAVSDTAANTAVIEKMLRVMMLAPFLLILSGMLARKESRKSGSRLGAMVDTIPWFAVLFIVVSAINSLSLIPGAIVDVIIRVDTFLLAMAMVALGLRTHVGAIRQAGARPLLLAGVLFVFLMVGGYGLNRLLFA